MVGAPWDILEVRCSTSTRSRCTWSNRGTALCHQVLSFTRTRARGTRSHRGTSSGQQKRLGRTIHCRTTRHTYRHPLRTSLWTHVTPCSPWRLLSCTVRQDRPNRCRIPSLRDTTSGYSCQLGSLVA